MSLGRFQNNQLKALCERAAEDDIHGHPGLVIKFLIQTFGITKKQLAHRLGIPVREVSRMIHGGRLRGAMCIWLAQAFPGTEPEWWALQEAARGLRVAREKWQRRYDIKPFPKPYWHKQPTELDKCICSHMEWHHVGGCTVKVEVPGPLKKDETGNLVLAEDGSPLHTVVLEQCRCPRYFRVGSLLAYQEYKQQQAVEKLDEDPFEIDFDKLLKMR